MGADGNELINELIRGREVLHSVTGSAFEAESVGNASEAPPALRVVVFAGKPETNPVRASQSAYNSSCTVRAWQDDGKVPLGIATVIWYRMWRVVPALKEDISVAISKLDIGVEDVRKQIKALRRILNRKASVCVFPTPFWGEKGKDTLERVQQANGARRRMGRFGVLVKRLEVQMSELGGNGFGTGTGTGTGTGGANGGGEKRGGVGANGAGETRKTRNAPSPSALLDGPDGVIRRRRMHLRTASRRCRRAPVIFRCALSMRQLHTFRLSRKKVREEMETMVLQGLMSLDQSLLASSLQTAYNLRTLPTLVAGLVRDLSEAVEERIRNTFDLSRISKGIVANEPTNVTAPQFAAALWARTESLVEEMAGCCIKDRVLSWSLAHSDFLRPGAYAGESTQPQKGLAQWDIVPRRGSQGADYTNIFWTSLGKSLDKHARDAAKGSGFLHQTLGAGYPKLLRLFHEFFASIAVHTNTVYTQSYQSPETILLLRALSTFEALHVSRSSTRMNEAVAHAFSGGSRALPGANEGNNIVRTVTNELDDLIPCCVVTRADGLIVFDRSAVSLLGPMATPQQLLNGQVATCLYCCWTKLDKLIRTRGEPSITKMRSRYDQIVDPLLSAIKKVARVHWLDLRKMNDPKSDISGTNLVDKLNVVKTGLLSNFTPEIVRPWVPGIVKYVIRMFVMHASIAKPLGECGKLQLTTDMAELEFSLNAFLADGSQSILWALDLTALSRKRAFGLARSPLQLPHTLHGWQEAEYVCWVDQHAPEEALSLIDGCISHWEKPNDYADRQDSNKVSRYHFQLEDDMQRISVTCECLTVDVRIQDWISTDEPQECLDTLSRMERLLQRDAPSRMPSMSRTGRGSNVMQDKIKEASDLFNSCKGYFHFLFSTEIWDNEKAVEKQQDVPRCHPEIITTVHETVHSQDKRAASQGSHELKSDEQKEAEERKLVEILKWLDGLNCAEKHDVTLSLRQEDTCEWLFNTTQYRTWRGAETGAGKSVLVSFVIDSFKKARREGDTFAFFYCDFRNERSTSSAEVLRSILSQLLRQLRGHSVDLKIVLDALTEAKEWGGGTLSNPKELADVVSRAARLLTKKSLVIVDALDECKDVQKLIQALIAIRDHVCLFIASRPLRVIMDELSDLPFVSMEDMADELSTDIKLHVTRELDVRRRLRDLDSVFKMEIRTVLCDKADGMFRWVQCSIDTLDRCVTRKEVRDALHDLPTGLDETYERILLAIDMETLAGRLAQRALSWLVAALRPLRLSEIMEALSINLQTRTLDFDIGPMHSGALLDACGSLVTYTEKTGVIILSHFSVKVKSAVA
ncbi:hypothetical protein EV363DRAFT_1294575 [Boletus edulis]|nr:hypothetical protein EV363DRAFT_1294575 [Boletus edulis]